LLLIYSYSGYSQISKGTNRVGAKISNNLSVIDNDRFSRIEIGLSTGRFVTDKFELGLNLDYVRNFVSDGARQSEQTRLFVGPTITYMAALNEKLKMPFIIGAGTNSMKVQGDNIFLSGEDDFSYGGFSALLGMGLEYFPTPKLGIRVLADFEFGFFKDDEITDQADFGASDISFGLNYYFSKN